MKQYGLYNKGIEKLTDAIKKTQAQSLEEAISIFASIKKLSKKNISEIFVVREIPTK